MKITELIKNKIVVFDGATGSVLQSRGLKSGELTEGWNLTHPEEITKLHREYLLSGCDIIKTNTFGANKIKAEQNGYDLKSVVASAIDCANKAVTECKRGYIALDIGPSGKLLSPMGDLDFEDAVDAFAETIRIGAKGADLVLIETFSDIYEAKAAIIAAKENCDLPIFLSFTFGLDGRLMTGATPECVAAFAESIGVDALGVNCGFGPDKYADIVKKLAENTNLPIFANPNAGLPNSVNGKTEYSVLPDEFCESICRLIELGANAVGGCCGTTPEYILSLISAVDKKSAVKRTVCDNTTVTSGNTAVTFSDKTVVIGERINPTGKKKLKEALRNNDMAYIIGEALSQEKSGADILDVNVGLPEICEADMLYSAVSELQKVTYLPLQIDTADINALKKSLRVYNGKPLINSVNGTKESMENVFPLVKKYGGCVVALTLDESGIPDNANDRLKIAQKIVVTAKTYGINKKDIIVDPLALAVSADNTAAKVTLDSVKLITNNLGVKTVLGVSNISFGLPKRENVTSAFLNMAMQNGLSAAILNPLSERIMSELKSYNALCGYDADFDDYISFASEEETNNSTEKLTLTGAVISGLEQSARDIALEEIKTKAPMEVINSMIIPALDKVGIDFEKGRIFLPQLLKSAAAASAAFASVKTAISTDNQEVLGKIVLATVKGDIHDIGKNIVKVMLENYGFQVIDLGRDVEPKAILKAAKENDVKIVGLSALMTTTLPAMKDTVDLLKREMPDCKTVVGGAVLNQEYADSIGADCYSVDAMETVRYAQKIYGVNN